MSRITRVIALVPLVVGLAIVHASARAAGDDATPSAAPDEAMPSPSPPQAPPVRPQTTTAASQTADTDQTYAVRLRDVEERVNDLKERVFQSKARLIQLQEAVLHGAISGAKAIIIHRNEMGGSFRLARMQYSLDGSPIYNHTIADDEQGGPAEVEIYNGNVAPGNHQLTVYLEYQGNGYGVFSYLKEYKFRVKSSQTLAAEEGKVTTVRVIGFEKGGITTELKDRPQVRYEIDIAKSLTDEKLLPSAKAVQPSAARDATP